MTIEINEDTPFLADITATKEDGTRYRLNVEDDGALRLYTEQHDRFEQSFWRQASGEFHQDVVARVIVALARQGVEGNQ